MPTVLAILADHPFFAGLSEDTLAQLSLQAVPRRLARGELLALEGDPCEWVYLVVEGRLHALKATAEGREQILSELGPGEVVHLVPALDDRPLPATVIAATRALVLAFARAAFLEMLARYPSIALAVLRDLARRLRQQSALIEDLALRSVPERLARLLLEGLHAPQGQPVTQREMAARLGTVREVVARTLARFEARGWVQLGRGVIIVLDEAALQRVVAREELV